MNYQEADTKQSRGKTMRRNPEDFRRLDDKIRRLQEEHPILAWLTTIGVALLILGAAMLLRWGVGPQ